MHKSGPTALSINWRIEALEAAAWFWGRAPGNRFAVAACTSSGLG